MFKKKPIFKLYDHGFHMLRKTASTIDILYTYLSSMKCYDVQSRLVTTFFYFYTLSWTILPFYSIKVYCMVTHSINYRHVKFH